MDNTQKIFFHKERLHQNILFINDLFGDRIANWTFVIKAFRLYSDKFIEEISDLPFNSVASDNLHHLEIIKRFNPNSETWFLNYLGINQIPDFIDVNLTHSPEFVNSKTCLMISLDTKRYGVEYDPGFSCKRFGAYLDCANLPDMDLFNNWSSYNIPSDIIQSLGTSICFHRIDYLISKRVNHFRLGEILLTGKDLVNGLDIKGMRQDVFGARKFISYHFINNLNY